MKEYWW